MRLEEAKPCPFCGGEVNEEVGVTMLHMFSCPLCGACVSFEPASLQGRRSALMAWNRRVSIKPGNIKKRDGGRSEDHGNP